MGKKDSDRFNKVRKRILADIKPSKEELQETVYLVNKLSSRLKRAVPKDVEIRVTGSISRGTNLKGTADIDIFLLFSTKFKKDYIIKKGLAYGKKALRKGDSFEIKYAEHPYMRLYLNDLGIKADIVPAFKIDNIEKMGTAVDRTPLHTDFINSKFNEKMRDDTRVLKYLLKMNGIYGAEIKISGFSGYLCELLIYYSGSLEKLCEMLPKAKPPIVIGAKKGEEHEATKRFGSSFVVIDPVDNNRNVAAGVSMESLSRAILLLRRLHENPNDDIFLGIRYSSDDVSKKLDEMIARLGLNTYLLKVKSSRKTDDIIWPQARKSADILKTEAEKYGFRIYIDLVFMFRDSPYIFFASPKEEINTRVQKGPSVFMPKAVEDFMKHHKDAKGFTINGECICALVQNKYPAMAAFMYDVSSGKILGKRKDIDFSKCEFFFCEVPENIKETIYIELSRKLSA